MVWLCDTFAYLRLPFLDVLGRFARAGTRL